MWIEPHLTIVKKLGMEPVEVSIPDWPYDSLNLILFAEAAAAFEEFTLSHQVDRAKSAGSRCMAQYLPAVALSFRGRLRADRPPSPQGRPGDGARLLQVDLLLVPSLRDEMLVITNNTGHPSLTLRAGFVEVSEARSDWAPDPQHPLAEVLSTAPRSSRRHPGRPPLR